MGTHTSGKGKQDASVREIRRKIAEGLAAAHRGDVHDGEGFFRELQREEGRRARARHGARRHDNRV